MNALVVIDHLAVVLAVETAAGVVTVYVEAEAGVVLAVAGAEDGLMAACFEFVGTVD